MKLLLDENVSPHLVAALSDEFPGSVHVRDIGLARASDAAIWVYVRDHGLTIPGEPRSSPLESMRRLRSWRFLDRCS